MRDGEVNRRVSLLSILSDSISSETREVSPYNHHQR
jgi:hypothetical protein